MKKLLSLVLVLALCSISSAMVINITNAAGESEISGLVNSDYVDLLVWYTGTEGMASFDIELGSDNHAAGTLAQPVLHGGSLPYVGPGMTLDWEIANATQSPPLASGILNPLATVTFHCEGPGDVVISGLYVFVTNSNNEEVVPTINGMIIHQIPEPATIALLCLGGLLLRKKR